MNDKVYIKAHDTYVSFIFGMPIKEVYTTFTDVLVAGKHCSLH